MGEGSLYDRELAALAVKQAQGDLIEAAFLLRAYRTTLPRFAHSRPVDTAAMQIERRDLGDLQGPARRTGARPDLRLHASAAGFSALAEDGADAPAPAHGEADATAMPRVSGHPRP